MGHNVVDLLGIASLVLLLIVSLVSLRDQKKIQAQLREQRDFSEAVLDVAGMLVLVMDVQGRILSFNKACERLSGHAFEEARGRHPWDFLLPPEVAQEAKDVFAALVAGRFPNFHENDWLTRHGERRLIAWANTALTDEDSRITHVIATGIDITARRAAELALGESEARFRDLVETSSDWVWEVDASGTYTYASPQVLEILGYAPEEVTGKTPFDFMPPDECRRIKAIFAEVAKKKTGISMLENMNLHRDGHRVLLETSAVPILDEKGELIGYRGVDRDITVRKAEEASLCKNALELAAVHRKMTEEQDLALEIMRHMTRRHECDALHVPYWVQPSSSFNGDALCTARSPDGKLYVMLADSTGHGLPAAVCLLPAVTVFYGMAKRGFPLTEMVDEINRQLRAALPSDHFLAAGLFKIDGAHGTMEWWLGGMPPILVFDGDGRLERRLASDHLPLGVSTGESAITRTETFGCKSTQQFLLYTDGIVEATDASGEAFGEARLIAAFQEASDGDKIAAIRDSLKRHLATEHAADDMSLIILDCTMTCAQNCQAHPGTHAPGERLEA